MNELFSDDLGEREEMKKLIANMQGEGNLHESAEKFVKMVDENQLDQKEACKPLLQAFCDVLREKGYPLLSESFSEKWHIQ